jgi:hypothetical protein
MNRRPFLFLYVLVWLMVWSLGWALELGAQSRVLLQREEEERAKQETKPPGKTPAGPQDKGGLGYGAIQQPPKGARDFGLKPDIPKGHVSPSAGQATSRDLPPAPKSVHVPKEPEVPKAVRGLPPGKPKSSEGQTGMVGIGESPSTPESWVKEEYEKLKTEGDETLAEEGEEGQRSGKTAGEENGDRE